jgi:two-component system, sensor histidine kinase and response regulator
MSDKAILLAEDNAVNQKVALLLLERFGFTADAVENGRQAVQAFSKGHYDLILMDVMMPDMDGLQATRQIRELEQSTGGHVPIIALTAMAMVGDRERCLEAGMDDYITKPIDPEHFREKVEGWLSGQTKAQTVVEKKAPERDFIPVDLASLQRAYGQEDLTDILKLFLNLTTRSLGEIENAINERAYAKLEFLAHELKGSSAAIYAIHMSETALRLEQSARKQNDEQVRNLNFQLKQQYIELQQYLQASLQST